MKAKTRKLKVHTMRTMCGATVGFDTDGLIKKPMATGFFTEKTDGCRFSAAKKPMTHECFEKPKPVITGFLSMPVGLVDRFERYNSDVSSPGAGRTPTSADIRGIPRDPGIRDLAPKCSTDLGQSLQSSNEYRTSRLDFMFILMSSSSGIGQNPNPGGIETSIF